MKKVITYGTFDCLHEGHRRLLERAKALGDWLIVGVTSDDYDRTRGKINAAQSLMERVEAVKGVGLADEIIVEEYEGQKIDDIRRLGVDVFTVGSDWVGKFDYLREWCEVVYLPRTQGVSSSEIRGVRRGVRLGIFGTGVVADKYRKEVEWVNGMSVGGQCAEFEAGVESLAGTCDAVYVVSHPRRHAADVRSALEAGMHVLCESPVALSGKDFRDLVSLAAERRLVLMDAIKTAYATAYNRMLLVVKSGKIGRVVSVDATCTSLMPPWQNPKDLEESWNSRQAWAPAALLTVFQLLGTHWERVRRKSFFAEGAEDFDLFTKYDFEYEGAVASVKVGKGVKSEGELVVSGTDGYIYVPSPWWKTDYFEERHEKAEENRRFFYQLDGEGIRAQLVAFSRAIATGRGPGNVTEAESEVIAELVK
ncbi:MAG: adenylyltransferase/cytidyltransferase family protein [Kiritimatiellae bacterium]|nr:adenylyltransferase/cytidyltransferase family protein [Kiritimatiellia bacterium]